VRLRGYGFCDRGQRQLEGVPKEKPDLTGPRVVAAPVVSAYTEMVVRTMKLAIRCITDEERVFEWIQEFPEKEIDLIPTPRQEVQEKARFMLDSVLAKYWEQRI
jgi:hypothetical protein